MIIVESRALGPMFKNGFIVACPRSREAVYIDPGDEVDELLAYVRDQALTVRWIMLTHAHIDHVTGVPAAVAALGAPVALHRDDLPLYRQAPDWARMFGLALEAALPPVDHLYEKDGRFVVGDFQVRVLHTPGHCPGGVCLEVIPAGPLPDEQTVDGRHRDLFVGDTLFAGGIGRTDLPGADHRTLLDSIRHVLLPLGGAARVHPGHGPSTTIGKERSTNRFLIGM